MTLKDFFDAVEYRISEGSAYGWKCFGANAYTIDAGLDDSSGSVIFDTKTQVVFEVTAYDYERNNYYRWVNPAYTEALRSEAVNRGLDHNIVFDDEKFVDLETEEDILEKLSAIIRGEEYDTRVQIPLTIDDDLLLELFRMAHDRDITLNRLIEEILQEVIDRYEPTVNKANDDWEFA